MEKWMKKTIELGAGLAFTGKENPSVVPYYPQKTELPKEEEKYFRRTFPEKVGVRSGRLLAMLKALEREKRANVHNLIVIKDKEVICECSHPGYSVNMWHLSHSMSKTLTGMAIGMLVDDGLLTVDTKLCDLYPSQFFSDKRFKNVTVKHLLTMATGVRFSEPGSVSELKWTDAFFESALSFNPGSDFSYNSMNSYILARIVCDLTGRSLTDFLTDRLLKPLEIENFFWEMGPEGIEKGGWGVYMSAESWGKVGLMMLEGGSFEGKRILSEEWVKESIKEHMQTPETIGHYNYGYQLWVSRTDDSFLFNGMLGQNVWICPRNNLVLVLNSGNNELFQKSPAMAIIERYLGQDLSDDLSDSCFAGDLVDLRRAEESFFVNRHWIRPLEAPHGIGYRLGLREKEAYPEVWNELVGRYQFRKNNYGILPLFIRGMQNNLKNSIDGVSFDKDGEELYFVFSEGGSSYRMAIGFYDFKETVLEYHGEKYLVNVMGEAMEDEDREMLFKLEILLPEMPNTRKLKFSIPEYGQLLMRMSEMPNNKIADLFFDDMPVTNPRLAFVFGLVEKKLGKNYVRRKLEEVFSPSLLGAKVGSENYQKTMNEEREKLKSVEKTAKLINTVIEKFLHDEEDMDEEEKEGGFRLFIKDIMNRVREKIPQKEKTDRQALPPAE